MCASLPGDLPSLWREPIAALRGFAREGDRMTNRLRIGCVCLALVSSFAVSMPLWSVERLSAAQTYRPGRVDYDIVYVRQPRFGDTAETTWPEVFHPARIDPGADLMLLQPDGTRGGVGRGRQRRGHGSVRLVRRAVGLLRRTSPTCARGLNTQRGSCRTRAPTSTASISRPDVSRGSRTASSRPTPAPALGRGESARTRRRRSTRSATAS